MQFVLTNPPRISDEVLKGYAGIGTATIGEAQRSIARAVYREEGSDHHETGHLKPYMRPITDHCPVEAAKLGQSWRITGSAVTCKISPGHNTTIHMAIEQIKDGDVLVVALTPKNGKYDYGNVGELIVTQLQKRGAAGMIIDASVRDVAEVTAMNFPIWSRGVSIDGTGKKEPGSVNVPVLCAGQWIRAGDLVAADMDGVVVVPREIAADVLKASQARTAKEDVSRAAYEQGALSLDRNDIRSGLVGIVTYVDFDKYEGPK